MFVTYWLHYVLQNENEFIQYSQSLDIFPPWGISLAVKLNGFGIMCWFVEVFICPKCLSAEEGDFYHGNRENG